MDIIPSIIKMVGPPEIAISKEIEIEDPVDLEEVKKILESNEITLSEVTKDYTIINHTKKDSNGCRSGKCSSKHNANRLNDKKR